MKKKTRSYIYYVQIQKSEIFFATTFAILEFLKRKGRRGDQVLDVLKNISESKKKLNT